MNTEAFMEGQRVDVSNELSTLMTFAIDDIRDFAERSTAWSKAVVLPGTANNNKLFGHIFDIGHSNTYDSSLPNIGYNFNAAKSASFVIFQGNIQTFKGVIRLLQIVVDKGVIEYETQVVGELSSLNAALSSGKLEDLDFSEYDHDYTLANIVASWDNPGGSGYYYPLIDYGNYGTDNKHNWDIRTFRPALYAKEYLDKMFIAANFRYNCDLFNTARFKSLVVPNNRKNIQKLSSEFLNVGGSGSGSGNVNYYLTLSETTTIGNFSRSGTSFIYNGDTITGDWTFSMTLTYSKNSSQQFFVCMVRNSKFFGQSQMIPIGPTSGTVEVSITTKDFTLNDNDSVSVLCFGYGDGSNYSISYTNAVLKFAGASDVIVPIGPGEPIDVNLNLPQNIRQVDFLKSIVQLFNLYVIEDRFDERLIHITPYVEYYTGEDVDWTYKLNRDKPIFIKPMSELNAKLYEFKFKSDSDYYNDQYKKRYNQGYGDYLYDSEFEFTAQKKTLELIFSSTPLVGYQGEDKVYPTIFKRSGDTEEQVDSNIRLLQSKKITGVSTWSIKDGEIVLGSYTAYPYAGHYDDPDAPTNDLNFGVCKELFYTLSGGDLSTTQFNVYYSSYMAEITDKDSKLVIGNFYLKPSDIATLDFSKYIILDGVCFRLNKIIEYNMSNPDDCKVELLKVNHTTYEVIPEEPEPITFDFRWEPQESTSYCEQNVDDENTGYKIYVTLLKVVDGGINDGQALDVNNELVDVSGLPQDSKANDPGDPDYVSKAYNTGDCPRPAGSTIDYNVTITNPSSSPIVIILFDNTSDTEVLNESVGASTNIPAVISVVDDAATLTFQIANNGSGTVSYQILVNGDEYTSGPSISPSGLVSGDIPKGEIEFVIENF